MIEIEEKARAYEMVLLRGGGLKLSSYDKRGKTTTIQTKAVGFIL